MDGTPPQVHRPAPRGPAEWGHNRAGVPCTIDTAPLPAARGRGFLDGRHESPEAASERYRTVEALVLNAGAIPVSIVSWRRAVVLVQAGKAIPLAHYEKGRIRSSGFVTTLPTIARTR